MKSFIIPSTSIAILLSVFLQSSSSSAQDAKPEDPYKKPSTREPASADAEELPANLSLHFEVFSMSLADASSLMREPLDDGERLQRVIKMVAEGKAKQERLIVVRTKSGQRMVSESIDEYRYATQWGLADFGTLSERRKAAQKEGGPVELKPGDPEVVFKDQISGIGIIATNFETRNTGDTIEIEPVLGPDGSTIDVNLVPQSVHHISDTVLKGPNPIGQPVFETQKTVTSVSLEKGKPFLLGTRNPPVGTGLSHDDAAHQIWLEFITPYIVSMGGVTVRSNASPGQSPAKR